MLPQIPERVRKARAARAVQAADPEGDIARVIGDVQRERLRQISVEGWSLEHDDEHRGGELACAAAVYALLGGLSGAPRGDVLREVSESLAQRRYPRLTAGVIVRALWPFSWHWFRPREPRRDLVRAAALLVAEIERRDRAAGADPAPCAVREIDLLRGE